MKFRSDSNYLNLLDQIVRHVESVELLQLDDGLQVVDLVVRDPQLLQRLAHRLDPRQALDQVATQRQDFQVLQVLQVLDAGHQSV